MKYAKCHYTNAAGRTRLVNILISGVSSQPNMYTQRILRVMHSLKAGRTRYCLIVIKSPDGAAYFNLRITGLHTSRIDTLWSKI